LFGWVAGFNNGTQPARQATHSLSLRIRQRRRTIHEYLTRHAKTTRNLGERRTLTPRPVLSQVRFGEEAAGGLVTDAKLHGFRLNRRMPALDMDLLMNDGTPLLHLIQPIVNPNIDTISTSRNAIGHAHLKYHCQTKNPQHLERCVGFLQN